jgi:hypothetical protein
MRRYDKVLHIVRNPYDALVAERKRLVVDCVRRLTLAKTVVVTGLAVVAVAVAVEAAVEAAVVVVTAGVVTRCAGAKRRWWWLRCRTTAA